MKENSLGRKNKELHIVNGGQSIKNRKKVKEKFQCFETELDVQRIKESKV